MKIKLSIVTMLHNRKNVFSIFVLALAIYSQLDATPFLYLAEIYVSKINPKILPKTFHSNTVTLITGASSGIGAELAYQLCTQTSTNLILVARRYDKLQEVKERCVVTLEKEAKGDDNININRIYLAPLDVTKGTASITENLQLALNDLGKKEVDIAFVNAGRGYGSAVKDTEEELIREIMELNYMAAVSTVKAVLSTYTNSTTFTNQKQMIAISSMAAKLPVAMAAGYSASKAAMISFFDSLRSEYSGSNMRVSTVCPGPVQTDIRINSRRDNVKGPIDYKESEESIKQQMTVERAVKLTLAGILARPSWLFHELWYSPQPILTFGYIGQYLPDLAKFVGKPVGSCNGSEICEAQRKRKV